jgi:AraC-like DNA-binding protein
MVMFLCGHRHNYSHLLEQEAPDPAPSQVRKAEDYIAEHCQQAISLEDLARVSGVSGFSLFRSFRKTRGYSPFELASRLRSEIARRQS